MKQVACHDRSFDPFDERLKYLHGTTTLIDHRAVGNVDANGYQFRKAITLKVDPVVLASKVFVNRL